jgi:hypothetical protein
MEKEWVKVFASGDTIKTKWLQSTIEANDIDVVVMNKKDSMLPFGEIELYVDKADEEHALVIINSTSDEDFMDEE